MAAITKYSPSQMETKGYEPVKDADGYYIKHVTKDENGNETSSEIIEVIDEATYNQYKSEEAEYQRYKDEGGTGEYFNSEMDDDLIYSYSNAIDGDFKNSEYNAAVYNNNLSDLRITNLKSVFGLPFQFLPNTDPRADIFTSSGTTLKNTGDIDSIGRMYAEKILAYIPLLLITPGVPQFMSKFNKKQQNLILSTFFSSNDASDSSVIDAIFGEYGGKYYTLKFAYTDYYRYVNAMLRSAAVYLGIQDVKIKGTNGHDEKLAYKQWYADSNVTDTGLFSNTGALKFLGPYAGALAFYADAGNTVDDSFSNSTTQSSLFSSINELGSKAQELNFLAGTAGSLVGLDVGKILGTDNLEERISDIKKAVGGNNIFSHILGKAQTIIAGGKMIFPEIWSDSNFSRSYSAKLKLVAPSGDKLSIYLNILVPIYHLMALVLPRQAESQAYYSPFLVRAYYQSLFNIDMGLITSLNVTKGAEGEWTKDGLPTVAEVSFEIKDLYEAMSMSSMDGSTPTKILSNIQELDYIANSCGININDQEIARTITLFKALYIGKLKDSVQIGIFGEIKQYFNQKVQNLFGKF